MKRDYVLMQAARLALRQMERLGRSSRTGTFCPTCYRATIRREGGEWCRWCRGWIADVAIYKSQEQVSGVVRALVSHRL